jgi:hypothetical protein
MGRPHFKVGSEMMQGVTIETTYADAQIMDDAFRVIDTQGYCDPEGKDYNNSK